MTFFNKKTDVINFELTPLGRTFLAQGKLSPRYYEFYDDDILYDVSYDGNSRENQEDAHNRIVNETPKLKNILIKSGVESNFVPTESDKKIKDRINNRRLTYEQRSIAPLGKSSYVSNKSPRFQIYMIRGQIAGSTNYLTSSLVTNMPIPQVEIDINAIITTGSVFNDSRENYNATSRMFDDGKFVILEIETPIIHVVETESFYEKENFEVEVYHIEDDTMANQQQIEKIVPLLFKKERSHVINGIYYKDPQGQPALKKQSPWEPEVFDAQPDEVEYYFDLVFDRGIADEEICKEIGSLPIKNQFLDREIKCLDERTERFNIYGTRVLPEDVEDCD